MAEKIVVDRLLISKLRGGEVAHIYNVQIAVKDTEYSQALPAGTIKYRIFAVTNDKKSVWGDVLNVAFEASASATIPTPPGGFHQEDGVRLTDKTLYFSSPSAPAWAIIIAWTKA